jgi:hypothetical protein
MGKKLKRYSPGFRRDALQALDNVGALAKELA